MKHKYINKILLIVVFVLIGLQSMPVNAKAKTTEDVKPDGDLKPMEMYALPEEEFAESQITVYSGTEISYSGVYRDNWEVYGNDYCYQNLSATEKQLYDAMYDMCELYMNTRMDAKDLNVNGNSVSGIGKFSYSGMSTAEMEELTYVFIFQNPQFYFINSSVYYNEEKSIFYIQVYDIFAEGDLRSDMSVQMYDKIDAWVTEIKQESTQYDKEKKAHDIVCNQTIYQKNTYDQSAYSTVMLGKTVCAGYTKLYAILTNAAGLETVSVTSETHGWNRTKLGSKWYNVDTTWDDGTIIQYTYFNKSDATMISYDGSSSESHTQHSYYDPIAPVCMENYNSIEATAITVSPSSLVLDMNGTKTASLSVAITPTTTSDTRIAYTSGDTSIVTVDSFGTVTAVAPGSTTVTARKKTNNLKSVSTVSVYGTHETPAAPVKANRTSTSVTLNEISGCVYSKDKVNWQESATFSGLQPYTSYTFYAKKVASGYYRESAVSAGRTIKTLAEGETDVPEVSVQYQTHIQTYGWEKTMKKDGAVSGTSRQSKRLEAIKIRVTGNDALGVQYTTHCQSYGWLPWSANGEMNGTEGEAKRLEAIEIRLTGADKDLYDIYYRVHAQSYGWLGWAKNGAPAGTAGYSKRLEAIQICVVKKGDSINTSVGGIASRYSFPYIARTGSSPVVAGNSTSNENPQIAGADTVHVAYKTHVQTYGWQGWRYDNQMSGTTGQAKRLEGIRIRLTNQQYSGDIRYTTHVQSYGWQGDIHNASTWSANGDMSGTSGQSKRLEAICITLTGDMAKHYDVYYRVHAQTFGWLDWAKNGQPAGTAGLSKRLEGIQIVLVPKDGQAPGSTVRPYVSR